MSPDRAPHTAKFSAIADRLLAHARLCEQIAQECWNKDTAQKLRRMAEDCARTAAELAPATVARHGTRH